jgi:hypothetical protein
MTIDPDEPEELLSVPNDVEAAAIVNALADYEIEAFAAGGYTAGFQVAAPGEVSVLVKRIDLERAKNALEQIRQQPPDSDE